MNEVTFSLAILLAVGLIFAKMVQLVKLPSVTGFILAGIVLGPSCLGLITTEAVGHRLDHFTQIALMLIAFGIGEHMELGRLGNVAKDVVYISIVQALGSFLLVSIGILLTFQIIEPSQATLKEHIVLSILLGAVAVATAPAAVLHIVRESGARGTLTSTLMAVVAVDDGIAIIIFGMAVSAAHQIAGQGEISALGAILSSFTEISLSLALGIITGFLIDYSLNKLHNRGEMLTGGLALLLLCGETTRFFHLSPLLAGMSAGFTIINRAERDVRLFRTINSFEPPIYVLFFTLAGVHLDIHALKLAGWIGLTYFFTRIIGKYIGTWLGAYLSGADKIVRNFLGLALIPQAGVAIGLIFIISGDPQLSSLATIITPVVLANVVFSELIGPLATKYTIEKAQESVVAPTRPECGDLSNRACDIWLRSPDGIRLSPWSGNKLHPPTNSSGFVVFGAYHPTTVRGLARIATIMAHHYHAMPLSVRIFPKNEKSTHSNISKDSLFLLEEDEVKSLGYPLHKEILYDRPADGLVSAIEYNNAHYVILGYPIGGAASSFHKVLEKVSSNVLCPVLAVHFAGQLAFDSVLIPFLAPSELDELLPTLEAISTVDQPNYTFMQLLRSDSSEEEISGCKDRLNQWLEMRFFDIQTRCKVITTESRLETIINQSSRHDLIIMSASRQFGLKKMFFGSLADSVVTNSNKSMLIVHTPQKQINLSKS